MKHFDFKATAFSGVKNALRSGKTLAIAAGAVFMISCGGNNSKFADAIREKESFPKTMNQAIFGVYVQYGADTVLTNGYEAKWAEAGLLKATFLGMHKDLIGTKTSYFGIELTAEGKKYLLPESEWKNERGYREGIYRSQFDKWTLESIPEAAKELPIHIGVVKIGVVDLKKIVSVEDEGKNGNYQSFIVKWKGGFTESTPFSAVYENYADPAYTFQCKITTLNGKVEECKNSSWDKDN